MVNHRSESGLRKHWREHEKSSSLKYNKKKKELSLEVVRIQLRLGFDLRPRSYESHALITQPRTLNTSQTKATKKAENRYYESSNATERDYRQSTTKLVNTFICKLGLKKKKVRNKTRTLASWPV